MIDVLAILGACGLGALFAVIIMMSVPLRR